MAYRCSSNLSRALSVADYILEDDGHSIEEAAEEFRLCKTTIQRDINLLGELSQCYYDKNYEQVKEKYIAVCKTLIKVTKRNNKKNIQKFNLTKMKKTNN